MSRHAVDRPILSRSLSEKAAGRQLATPSHITSTRYSSTRGTTSPKAAPAITWPVVWAPTRTRAHISSGRSRSSGPAVAIVNAYKLGNPLDPETTLGPMAHVRFADTVRGQTADAIKAGAQAHIDPANFPQDNGAYLMPQILTNVTHDMRVMREESFGPVVGIMPVKNDAEAIRLMNDSDFGLTASLWTQDANRAEAIADQLETGTVFMNRADYLDPGLCWTGCKDTGRGGGLSVIGYHNLTRPKSYHLKKA